MIINKTRNTVVCKKSKYLKSILSKSIGLMFSQKIYDTGLIFVFNKPTVVHLHMFFVFFPIDVFFLNKNKKVIELKENFLPFTLWFSKVKSSFIIETPKNTIKNSNTRIGDTLAFK